MLIKHIQPMIAAWLERKIARKTRRPGNVQDAGNVPAGRDASRTLAFMHVPKTAGTAVTQALIHCLNPSSIEGWFDRSLFGSFQDFASIHEDFRKCIHASASSLRLDADLVAGHFSLSTLRQAYPNAQFLTILREPISRLLSHWLFWRQHSDADLEPFGKWGDWLRIGRQPFATFLSDPLIGVQTDNLALRMLLWPHPLIPDHGFINPVHDAQLLTEATERLNAFDFVDIVENDGLERNLQQWLGRPLFYERRNETHEPPGQFRSALNEELTHEAFELLCARTRLDRQLWASIAHQKIPNGDIAAIREQALLVNIARFALLAA